jgi:murein DD-endopeptidase MepM/ murein hydrolase activator NlpD
MEQIKKFLHGKGFALLLTASLLAAAAAGVWAVRALRAELQKSLDGLNAPDTTQQTTPETEPDWDAQEDTTWQQPVTDVANSKADVPQQERSGASSGAQSGSGSLREPSALQGASSPASSSAQPAAAPSMPGRVLNAFSGDELVYNKTLGDWRTHNGADYAAKAGEEVSPVCGGTVTAVTEDALWGTVVEITDEDEVLWRYCGLTDAAVQPGEGVTTATTLGKVGSIPAESKTAAHIHLECLKDDAYQDPESMK